MYDGMYGNEQHKKCAEQFQNLPSRCDSDRFQRKKAKIASIIYQNFITEM